jgi:very-short-patch-repair endonuclease
MRSGGTESESAAEEALHLIRAAGLPQPEQQAYVLGYRVDFLWRAQRIAVEVEGFAYHRSRSSFQADRRRDADLLTRAGVVVIRLTVPMILGDQAGTVALLVRAIELGGRERSDLDSRFGSRRSAG